MERMKRAVCLLLCFVMVVGLLPMAAFAADNEVSGTGSLVGGTVYTLDTDGVTANKNYLIVNTNSGTGYALTNNNGSAGSTTVSITDGKITVDDDASIAWTFSSTESGTVGNNGRYLYPGNGSLSLNDSGTNLTISNQSNGAYRLYYSQWNYVRTYYYYVTYSGAWSGARTTSSSSVGSVYLYEYTSSSSGEAVTFTVAPGSATIAPNGTMALTGTVEVAGETVDLSDCTITWASSDTSKATVSNGTVTGVADGTANITATLSAVNGTALQENIVLTVPVTVQSKEVVAMELTGNDPVTTKQNVEPDFSNIKLKVTYDDGSIGSITTANGLTIKDYDITTVGYYYATIYYGEENLGTVRVTVDGNPYEGKDEATVYPEYPADGAVRIDKNATEIDFQNTGVVQVELDVAGVSVKPAVDVILVTDLSNSMAWAAGGKTNASTHEDTKLYDLQQSVASFADIFLAADEDGTATKNTMSLVTFGGFDADHIETGYDGTYADVTRTLLLGSSSADTVKTSINNIRLLVDSSYSGGYRLSFDGGQTYSGNYGNTNYDYAFMETSAAIAELKAAYLEENGTSYDESGRQIYILFMTDGAPSNYDGVYYRYQTSTSRPDVQATWTNANGDEVNYTMGNNNADYSNAAWFQYIAGSAYDSTNDTVTGNPLYWADQVYNTDNVANIYSVGFDLNYGGFSSYTFTLADGRPLSKVLENLVTGQTLEVYEADDEAGLSKIYADLATKIRFAGTQATVTDIVDSNFDLQLTVTTGTEGATTHGTLPEAPTITIKAYDLWTKEETSDTTLIGTRKGTVTDIETVTFNEAGTEAYSDLKDGNIMTTAEDGTVTIEGFYFTYTKTPESVETFSWNIGNITDKEIALSYYAYLTGTMEGTRAKGLYYTNEEATLEYVDINDKHATKIFPIPAVAWGGASTAYEFYLVNENGEPCDRNGTVVPFANRIIITGPYYEELYLNQEDEEKAKEIVAAYVLPAGYTLYDDTAKYTVITASGTKDGSLTISEPADGKAQTTILVSAVTPTYIQSRVAFGVMYNEIPDEADFSLTPDSVVIDYGKAIVVNIANGNEDLEDGYTAKLVGFSKYYDTVDMKQKFSSTPYTDNYKATYGTFSIENNGENGESTVRYTPTAIVNDVEMIFCVIEMHNATSNDTYYMVDWLTIIPATSVYYETDFSTNVFTTVTTGTAWNLAETVANDNAADNQQDDGTIGVGQTYGFDSSYENDKYLSNGSSYFVEGQGIKLNANTTAYTYADFSFKGTGFEIISRTGEKQGAIRVDIYADAAKTNKLRSVTVLNKSEAEGALELYQIPVVSVNDLDYGTYYVSIGVNAAYENESYPQLSRGGEFYFDALRVFEPVKGNTVAEEAYVSDGESDRQLDEVRQLLITADDFNALEDNTTTEGIVFVDRPDTEVGDDTNQVYQVSTYAAIGPNNETYLSKDQAVAFRMTVSATPASFDLGAKSVLGNTAGLKVTVTDGDSNSWTFEKDITSSTAQNYNLLSTAANFSSVFAGKSVYVIIENTADGVLSITDLKVAYGDYVAETSGLQLMSVAAEQTNPLAVSYTVDASTFAVARSVMLAEEAPEEEVPEVTEPEATEPETTEPETTEPETTEPEATEPETTEPETTEPETTEPETTEPVLDIIRVSANTKGGIFNRKTHFTVITTQDVASLKIAQMYWFVDYSSMTYEDLDNGTRVWTVVMPGVAIGTYTFTAYGEDGTRGDSASILSLGL